MTSERDKAFEQFREGPDAYPPPPPYCPPLSLFIGFVTIPIVGMGLLVMWWNLTREPDDTVHPAVQLAILLVVSTAQTLVLVYHKRKPVR